MGWKDKIVNKLVEKSPEQEEEEKRELEEQVGALWEWIRTHLDTAIKAYQHSGDIEDPQGPLTICLQGKALQDMVAYLESLRAQNLYITPQRSNVRLVLEDVMSNMYIVTEYFNDNSRLDYLHHDQIVDSIQASGEKAVRATIQTQDDGSFFITECAGISNQW